MLSEFSFDEISKRFLLFLTPVKICSEKRIVLHYVATFSHLAETFIYDLITNLNQVDWIKQILLCHNRINTNQRPFRYIEEVPFDQSPWGRIKRRVFRHHFDKRQTELIAKVFDSKRPGLIHCHFGINGVRALEFLERLNIDTPMLVHCHGTDILSLPFMQQGYRRKILAVAERPRTKFVANTEFLRDAMAKLGIPQNRIQIVRNSINPKFVVEDSDRAKPVESSRGRPMRVIAVGRTIRWKGHRFLLEGLSSFLRNFPTGARLTLIGDGDERCRLERVANDLGIGDSVEFRGALPHDEVAAALRDHDLLIQPSIVDPETRQCESFGMTILEAIASGLPVAVSRSGGMPELIGHETPWSRLFEPGSGETIARMLEEFYRDWPSLGSNHEYAKERLVVFSWENQRKALMEAYQNVLSL